MEKIKIHLSTKAVQRKRHKHMFGMGMKATGICAFCGKELLSTSHTVIPLNGRH